MKRLVRRFAKDRRGTVAYIALFAVVPLATALFLIIDAGQDSYDRIRAQNGADAIALTHAVWSARTLNTISMNNVALTQAFVVGLVADALDDALSTLDRHAALVGVEIALNEVSPPCDTNPASLAACAAVHVVLALEAIDAVRYTSGIRNRYDPAFARSTADRAIRALNRFNGDLVAGFPERMRLVSAEIARLNGISDYYFHGPCTRAASCRGNRSPQGLDLPVEKGTDAARREFCRGMENGTVLTRTGYVARGFPRLKGPFEYGGNGRYPNIRDYVNQLTDIGARLQRFKRYYDGKRLPGSNRPFYTNIKTLQSPTSNAFTRQIDRQLFLLCNPLASASFLAGFDITLPDFYGPIGLGRFNFTPIANPDDLDPQYKILAFARRKLSRRLGRNIIHRGANDAIGYAQAVVFNPEGISLYSQSWRSKLMPATRFSDPAAVGTMMRSRAPTAFGQIARRLERVRDTAGWSALNAH